MTPLCRVLKLGAILEESGLRLTEAGEGDPIRFHSMTPRKIHTHDSNHLLSG